MLQFLVMNKHEQSRVSFRHLCLQNVTIKLRNNDNIFQNEIMHVKSMVFAIQCAHDDRQVWIILNHIDRVHTENEFACLSWDWTAAIGNLIIWCIHNNNYLVLLNVSTISISTKNDKFIDDYHEWAIWK